MNTLKIPSLFLFCVLLLYSYHSRSQTIPRAGMIYPVDQDSLVYASGFRLSGESVMRMLYPSLTNQQFKANVKQIRKARCKVYLCNILFPSRIKIAGPEANEQAALAYLDTVFRRAKKARIPLIVLGSGGSRRIPQGYSAEKATADFISLCKKMAGVAQKYKITIALENLNSTETNFLTSVSEAAHVVRMVNHQNFRLNVDIYHMMRENEPPQSITAAASLLGHCEIAEKARRTLPGIMGDDFRPYLRALKEANYKLPIFIEGNTSNPRTEIPIAYQYLTRQIKEVFEGNE